MRTIAFTGLVLASSLALARTHAAPHVFEAKDPSGRAFSAHLSGFGGGQLTIDEPGTQRAKPHHLNISMGVYPSGNASFFDLLVSGFGPGDGSGPPSFEYQVKSPRDRASGQSTGRRASFFDVWCEELSIPPIDLDDDDPPPFVASFSFGSSNVNSELGKGGGTGRSGWTQPGFVLELDGKQIMTGVNTSRSNIKNQRTAQADGSVRTETFFDELAFRLPSGPEAQALLEAFTRDAATGQRTGRRMKYMVTDGGGPLIGFETEVYLHSVDDAFLFPLNGMPTVLQVVLRSTPKWRGHVTVLK